MVCDIFKKLIFLKQCLKKSQVDNDFLYNWLNKKKNLSSSNENEVLCDNNTTKSQLLIITEEEQRQR